ncbi:Prepilin peptidase [Desulfofundulus kuznetsovii DSM 6115]|uniref:Prepilin leader peptidase/N-methyltransferase n=1 Tax=Desulfofundulus kuznetsovii (strain DSM 6115 / VKM B-1805 / 17) TaxID=760568 RepID=A0AAU8PDV8_DESK7|nr:Prepilin peptidase [Desulfofundulus kuznetsovii DSM 6115]
MPLAWFWFFSFLLGLCIGSFLNVCIYRLPRGMSLLAPPSHCPACGARLGPLDLIPVVSYLFLRGRCRHCSGTISPRYPLVELLTGAGFLLIAREHGPHVHTAGLLVLFSVLVAASFIDLDHRIIPDRLTLFALAAGIPLAALQGAEALKDGLIGSVLGGGILLIVALFSRGGMGGGDVKLAFAIGWYLGWQETLVALFLAFLLGAVVGVLWALRTGRTLKTAIPFGPFLSSGAMLAALTGDKLISWYLNLWGG